ncbi:hypothetical protein F5880DRAFT_1511723 [Lentinula raphanica]|nr:hypothetical protein F5880DRAFT_1511723 [Lentinula raphanica]
MSSPGSPSYADIVRGGYMPQTTSSLFPAPTAQYGHVNHGSNMPQYSPPQSWRGLGLNPQAESRLSHEMRHESSENNQRYVSSSYRPSLPRPLTPQNNELPGLNHLLSAKRPRVEEEREQPKKMTASQKASSEVPSSKKARPVPRPIKKAKVVKTEDDDDEEMQPGGQEKKKAGGRTTGSTEYSTAELSAMVRFVHKFLPMGKKGWERVTNEYNKWASANGYPERQCKPFQTRWNRSVLIATTKPTGDADRLEMYERVIEAEAAIAQRVSLGSLQDSPDDDNIISISSEEEDDVEVTKNKGKKGTVLMKAYKVEPPLGEAPRPRISRQSQANGLLGGISASLNPRNIQQRDENRASMNLQMIQMQYMQTQLNNLQQRLDTATREAMEAQSELKMMRLLHNTRHRIILIAILPLEAIAFLTLQIHILPNSMLVIHVPVHLEIIIHTPILHTVADEIIHFHHLSLQQRSHQQLPHIKSLHRIFLHHQEKYSHL